MLSDIINFFENKNGLKINFEIEHFRKRSWSVETLLQYLPGQRQDSPRLLRTSPGFTRTSKEWSRTCKAKSGTFKD